MNIIDRVTNAVHELQRGRNGGIGEGAVIHVGRKEWCEMRAHEESPRYLALSASRAKFMGITVRVEPVDSFFEVKP